MAFCICLSFPSPVEKGLSDHNWNKLMNSVCEQKANLKLQQPAHPTASLTRRRVACARCRAVKDMLILLKRQSIHQNFLVALESSSCPR